RHPGNRLGQSAFASRSRLRLNDVSPTLRTAAIVKQIPVCKQVPVFGRSLPANGFRRAAVPSRMPPEPAADRAGHLHKGVDVDDPFAPLTSRPERPAPRTQTCEYL